MGQFAKNQFHQHTKAMITIMQYFKVTHTLGIIYGGDAEDLIIKVLSDSDWIEDYALQKSISRFIFI